MTRKLNRSPEWLEVSQYDESSELLFYENTVGFQYFSVFILGEVMCVVAGLFTVSYLVIVQHKVNGMFRFSTGTWYWTQLEHVAWWSDKAEVSI